MSIQNIDHVGIRVRDLEGARSFFGKVLGLEFGDPTARPELDLNNCMDATGVELIAPMSRDGFIARSIESRGEGLSLLSLRVDDMPAMVARLEALGVSITMRASLGDREIITLHPKQTYGAPIQLIQYTDRKS